MTVGPFDQLLGPLVQQYVRNIPQHVDDRIILPCFERQFAMICQQVRGDIWVVDSKELKAQVQSSLRTVTLPTAETFHHHLKLALACNITSALRTITPWTALVGPEVSDILHEILPSSMWVCRELAAATGSQSDFDVAKHFSVLIRENLEPRASARGETLIVAAALAEKGVDGGLCHAERVFGLDSEAKREEWFRQ